MPNAYDGFRSSRHMRMGQQKRNQQRMVRDVKSAGRTIGRELASIGRMALKDCGF